MLTKRTNRAVTFLCELVGLLVAHRLLSRKQIAILHMVQDLLEYFDTGDDTNLLRSVNALREYNAHVLQGLPSGILRSVIVQPVPEPEPETCFNCDTVLQGEVCPRCSLQHVYEDQVKRLEHRVDNLANDKSNLEYDLSRSQDQARSLEDEKRSLEGKLHDAESRASSSNYYSRW